MSKQFSLYITKLFVSAVALLLATQFLQNIYFANIQTCLFLVFILQTVGHLLKVILKIFTFPINLLTLGLFSLVIEGITFRICAAFLGSNIQIPNFPSLNVLIIIALLSTINLLFIDKDKEK